MEFIMKVWLMALLAALVALGYVAPQSFPRTGVASARPLDRIRIIPAAQERAVPQRRHP